MSVALEAQGLLSQLSEARQLLKEMGPEFSGFPHRLDELSRQAAEGRFRLAVLGQFKRGKSSLLNALLGEKLLPTGVLPLTALPTILRYGADRLLRVSLINGRSQERRGDPHAIAELLKRYVSEPENPANRLGVTRVEVEHPAPCLAKGVEILDTPGIGSTILHNTRMARDVVLGCDAALFILSPDPPITEVELEFLRTLKEALPKVIFVLAKADQLLDSERPELLAFLSDVIRTQGGYPDPGQILVVSAQQALQAHVSGDLALRERSGLDALENYLANFLVAEKQAVLQKALRRKAASLLAEALFTLDLHRKALNLPREDLERRRGRLEEGLAKIEQDRLFFRDRLAGDRERLLAKLDQESAQYGQVLQWRLAACAQETQKADPALSLAQLISKTRSRLGDEVERAMKEIGLDMRKAMTMHLLSLQDAQRRHIEQVIERVRKAAADLFEVPYLEAWAPEALETRREPNLISQRWVTSSFSEEAGLRLIRFLPARWRAKRFEEWLDNEIAYLVARNIEEVRRPSRQNLEDELRTFQNRIEGQLDSVMVTIRMAMQSALDRQSEREARQGGALQRMETYRARLEHLLAGLSDQKASRLADGPV
jgi:ribosome biogenesis GTPase A